MNRSPDTLREITPLLIGVQSHPERDVSLETLASEYGYSPSHFHRLFTAAVGETPKEHVDRVRLERAAYRLSLTKESVLDIALSVGFRNHETFSRAFKRRFDLTPMAWRRSSMSHQASWMETSYFEQCDGCELSAVSYLTLKPMTLLAMRRIGQYGTFGMPDFEGGPSDWSPLVDEVKRRGLPYSQTWHDVLLRQPGPYLRRICRQWMRACLCLRGKGRQRRDRPAAGFRRRPLWRH